MAVQRATPEPGQPDSGCRLEHHRGRDQAPWRRQDRHHRRHRVRAAQPAEVVVRRGRRDPRCRHRERRHVRRRADQPGQRGHRQRHAGGRGDHGRHRHRSIRRPAGRTRRGRTEGHARGGWERPDGHGREPDPVHLRAGAASPTRRPTRRRSATASSRLPMPDDRRQQEQGRRKPGRSGCGTSSRCTASRAPTRSATSRTGG